MANGNDNGTVESWFKVVAQYGITALLLSALMWFVGYKMVLPTQEANSRLIERVSATNEKNAETLSRQTMILEELRAAKK